MPRKSLPQSVCKSAAASVLAFTAGLTSESAEAEVMWTSGPSTLIGTYEVSSGVSRSDTPNQVKQAIDFDQDGKADFHLYYYFNFGILTTRNGYYGYLGSPDLNPTSNVVFSSAAPWGPTDNRWNYTPQNASSLEEVLNNALAFVPIPDDPLVSNDFLFDSSLDEVFSTRGFWSGTFQDAGGTTYVGYLDIEFLPASNGNLDSLAIYDSGFTQVPEPSSLALLGLGGLLLGRRRRG